MTSNTGWDAPLEEDLRKEFQTWTDSIPQLAEYTIARWWNSPKQGKIVHEWFHILADASSRVYGAVAYRRAVNEFGNIFVTILAARSHVVSKNASRASHPGSVPRLELVAAIKGLQLKHFLQAALGRKLDNCTIWVHSQADLRYIDLVSHLCGQHIVQDPQVHRHLPMALCRHD